MISVCQVELLGQELADYVHPCDHQQLASLVPDTAPDTDLDLEVQYTLTHSTTSTVTKLSSTF